MSVPGRMSELAIDLLARAAHERPQAPLLAGRAGPDWHALTNGEAWARSGAVASWLIAQGYGPSGRGAGKRFSVPAADSPQRIVLLLGALRAGALVVEGPSEVSYGVLANCSIDAAVAERRLHIDASTPARMVDGECRRHGDFASIAEAVSG
jgi:feruloyl-CoA synthase